MQNQLELEQRVELEKTMVMNIIETLKPPGPDVFDESVAFEVLLSSQELSVPLRTVATYAVDSQVRKALGVPHCDAIHIVWGDARLSEHEMSLSFQELGIDEGAKLRVVVDPAGTKRLRRTANIHLQRCRLYTQQLRVVEQQIYKFEQVACAMENYTADGPVMQSTLSGTLEMRVPRDAEKELETELDELVTGQCPLPAMTMLPTLGVTTVLEENIEDDDSAAEFAALEAAVMI